MKLDFKKNVKRNMLANAVSSGIRMLFPFINRTLFLWLLSPEYLGLNGLFRSILGVLMLAELGFGTAVVCSMYKSVADDDREMLCAYLGFFPKHKIAFFYVQHVLVAPNRERRPQISDLVREAMIG